MTPWNRLLLEKAAVAQLVKECRASYSSRRIVTVFKRTLCSWWSCRWGEKVSLNCGHKGSYCSSSRWYMSMERHGGMILTAGNRGTQRKAFPSTTSSTTNPTWTDPFANRGLRGERLPTNRLSHHTAIRCKDACKGKPRYSKKPMSQCQVVQTHPTWTDARANPGFRGERPATIAWAMLA
jgi:hypothetical protein